MILINEQFPAATAGNFANKQVGYLSIDGGVNALGTNVHHSFSISFDVKLTAPAGTPRREAGMRT